MNLIDSDVLIDIQRLTTPSRRWISTNASLVISLPAPVAIEFLIGSRNTAELNQAKSFLDNFNVLWLDENESQLAFQLVLRYRRSTGLGFADFHIAAQALNRKATLYTFNLKHFSAIEGLDARAPFER